MGSPIEVDLPPIIPVIEQVTDHQGVFPLPETGSPFPNPNQRNPLFLPLVISGELNCQTKETLIRGWVNLFLETYSQPAETLPLAQSSFGFSSLGKFLLAQEGPFNKEAPVQEGVLQLLPFGSAYKDQEGFSVWVDPLTGFPGEGSLTTFGGASIQAKRRWLPVMTYSPEGEKPFQFSYLTVKDFSSRVIINPETQEGEQLIDMRSFLIAPHKKIAFAFITYKDDRVYYYLTPLPLNAGQLWENPQVQVVPLPVEPEQITPASTLRINQKNEVFSALVLNKTKKEKKAPFEMEAVVFEGGLESVSQKFKVEAAQDEVIADVDLIFDKEGQPMLVLLQGRLEAETLEDLAFNLKIYQQKEGEVIEVSLPEEVQEKKYRVSFVSGNFCALLPAKGQQEQGIDLLFFNQEKGIFEYVGNLPITYFLRRFGLKQISPKRVRIIQDEYRRARMNSLRDNQILIEIERKNGQWQTKRKAQVTSNLFPFRLLVFEDRNLVGMGTGGCPSSINSLECFYGFAYQEASSTQPASFKKVGRRRFPLPPANLRPRVSPAEQAPSPWKKRF